MREEQTMILWIIILLFCLEQNIHCEKLTLESDVGTEAAEARQNVNDQIRPLVTLTSHIICIKTG